MTNGKSEKSKSLESWIWDAACSIRGAQDAPKYESFILFLIFTKRLCDVFDDELNRTTEARIAHATVKVAILQDLFRTPLHELMTVKTRVHKLDLSTCN